MLLFFCCNFISAWSIFSISGHFFLSSQSAPEFHFIEFIEFYQVDTFPTRVIWFWLVEYWSHFLDGKYCTLIVDLILELSNLLFKLFIDFGNIFESSFILLHSLAFLHLNIQMLSIIIQLYESIPLEIVLVLFLIFSLVFVHHIQHFLVKIIILVILGNSFLYVLE